MSGQTPVPPPLGEPTLKMRITTPVVLAAVLGLLLLLYLLVPTTRVIRPQVPGYIDIVDTGSMRPLITGNTTAYVTPAKVEELKVGDLVQFEQPKRGTISAHFVIAVKQAANGETYVLTKGLANKDADDLRITDKELIGRVDLTRKRPTIE